MSSRNGWVWVKAVVVVPLFFFVLFACRPNPKPTIRTGPPPDAFLVDDIDGDQVDLVWFEFPPDIQPGANEIQVFMARLDPPAMLVPMETELPCQLESQEEYLDFGPIPIVVIFEDTRFVGSYSWQACASCIECYMDWETRMELEGEYLADMVELDIGIRHMGHNIQDTYLSLTVPKSTDPWTEPWIKCRSPSDCKPIRFEQID
jgi:hypothetical protein